MKSIDFVHSFILLKNKKKHSPIHTYVKENVNTNSLYTVAILSAEINSSENIPPYRWQEVLRSRSFCTAYNFRIRGAIHSNLDCEEIDSKQNVLCFSIVVTRGQIYFYVRETFNYDSSTIFRSKFMDRIEKWYF